jgi:hypothetical protein
MEFVAVTQAAARLKLQIYEILQRLGVTILAFVVTDVNLRNVVGKIYKSKYLFINTFYSLSVKKEPKRLFFFNPILFKLKLLFRIIFFWILVLHFCWLLI